MPQKDVFDAEKLWLEKLLLFRYSDTLALPKNTYETSFSDLFSAEERQLFSKDISLIAPPVFPDDACLYATFIAKENLDFAERLLLALVFLPHVFPGMLRIKPGIELRAEQGFLPGSMKNSLLPTGQSFIHLYAGANTERKLQAMELLCGDSALFEKKLVLMDDPAPGEPLFSGRLAMSKSWIRLFILDLQPIQEYFTDSLTPENNDNGA